MVDMGRRLRVNDALRPFTGEQRVSVMVTWYARTDKQPRRLLRLTVAADGWHIVTDDFRVHPRAWLERVQPTLDDGTPATLELRDAGKVGFTNLRHFASADLVLPHDLDEWGSGRRFEVGCDAWGLGHANLDALRDDARRAIATRRAVRVSVDRENDTRVIWNPS